MTIPNDGTPDVGAAVLEIKDAIAKRDADVEAVRTTSDETRTRVDELIAKLEEEQAARRAIEDKLRDREVYLKNDTPDRSEAISFGRLFQALDKPALLEKDEFRREKQALEEGERALTFGTDSSGGTLVPEEFLPEEFINNLRAMTVAFRLGAREMSDLQGSPVKIPKKTGSASTAWIGEGGTITPSDQTFGELSMTPKKNAVITKVNYELTQFANPSIESIINEDLAEGLALELDDKALHGGGSNEPDGITQIAGINTKSLDAAPTLALLWDIVSEVEVDNGLNSPAARPGWAMHPSLWNVIRKLLQAEFTDKLIQQGVEKVLHGMRLETTTQIPTNLGGTTDETEIFFGDWRKLLIARWFGIRFMVSRERYFEEDRIGIRAIQHVDIGLRHPESMCYTVDARLS